MQNSNKQAARLIVLERFFSITRTKRFLRLIFNLACEIQMRYTSFMNNCDKRSAKRGFRLFLANKWLI